MAISFRQLIEADTTLWHESARAWRRLAGQADRYSDEADVEVARARRAWSGGEAAPTAMATLATLPVALSACRGPLLEVDQVLCEHAERVRRIQARLVDALLRTKGSGVHVSVDGEITAAIDGGPDKETVALAGWIRNQIAAAVNEAGQVDTATSRRLRRLADLFDTGPMLSASPPPACPPGGDPRAVANWWAGLTDEQRRWLIEHSPESIAHLDGVPATARDRANRLLLESERDRLTEALDQLTGSARRSAVNELSGLTSLISRLDQTEPRAYLLAFDPRGDGRVIVAFGDPDISANVATYVPGAGVDLYSIGNELTRAAALQERATQIDPAASTSTIMWLDYDAPDGLTAVSKAPAMAATAPLDRFQTGLVSSHEGSIGQQTLLGHSYGSVVVGVAERSGDLAANDLVLLGSPGVGVDHASQLRPAEQVWASTADNDIVRAAPSLGEVLISAPLGPTALISGAVIDMTLKQNADLWHGVDPSRPQFGAQTFASDRGSNSLSAHAGYFEPDNQSLQSMAEIVVGRR